MLMYGNIPNGSGLSSSASVELLMGIILKDLFGYEDLTMINLALIGQYGENNFNGMNCGIMDQFAIAMGEKGSRHFPGYPESPVRICSYPYGWIQDRDRCQQQEKKTDRFQI